jgi:hypothetical protein
MLQRDELQLVTLIDSRGKSGVVEGRKGRLVLRGGGMFLKARVLYATSGKRVLGSSFVS